MALTAQQAWTAYQGTPYENGLSDYINYTPAQEGWQGEGGMTGSTPEAWSWKNANSQTGYQNFVKSSEDFTAATSANPTSALVNYSEFKDDPAEVTAALTRAQWEDYKKRFVPTEDALMNMTSFMNPGIVKDEINAAVGTGGYVTRALDASNGTAARNISRYGTALTAEQNTAMQRSQSLNRSTAIVDAANNIRKKIADRDMQIAVGSIPNAGRAYGLPSTGE